ncbi:MAG: hypothetical protein HGA85_07245 [Nanoarchaeota archaeon]|nr:hypothetical protein [Nanoarchaeota archaeon]
MIGTLFDTMLAQPSFFPRFFGLLAFFFAGLTLEIGIFRRQLFSRFPRTLVIKVHSIIGLFALVFSIMHIIAVFKDAEGWAESLSIWQALFPDFSGTLEISISLGLIGLYMLIITILSGALFTWISKRLGHKVWLMIHRGSFVFYLLIFFHALRIGTDFSNPYFVVFFGHVIIAFFGYILLRAVPIRLKERLTGIFKKRE